MNNYLDFTFKIIIVFTLLYCFFYFLKPNTSMSSEDKQKMDSLIHKIDIIQREQQELDKNILEFEGNVEDISNKINKIKKDKSVIREVYHDQILRVSNFNDSQIDSFFSERYGYNPH